MQQPFSAPQPRRQRPVLLSILALVVLAAGALGGAWYWKHKHAAAADTKQEEATKPAVKKPDALQVTPDPDHKAFKISCTGYQVTASGVKNKVRQDGDSVLVLTSDWKRTNAELQSKSDLLCFAAPSATGQPIAHSDTSGHLSVPTGRPGLQYSLYFHRKDGSYLRQMTIFTIGPAGQAKPQAAPHRRHR